MAPRPRILRTVAALRTAVRRYQAAGEKIALVPTMGALHAGHRAGTAGAARARRVIVSIFVNPTQFAPHEDLASYPRSFDTDVAALAEIGADLVWAPSADAMYPPGFALRLVPDGPAKVGLEDAFRPHFFAGVATVVAKLLIQCAPDVAVFGERITAAQVIVQLARDLDLPVKIVAAATVRKRDGLALSSRNAYLSPAERAAAPALCRVLKDCAARIKRGDLIAQVLDEGGAAIEQAGFALDYFEARHADTLGKIEASMPAVPRRGASAAPASSITSQCEGRKNRDTLFCRSYNNPRSRNSRRIASGMSRAPGAARSRSRGASVAAR
jgi:pantoate--beta-alanine ligase